METNHTGSTLPEQEMAQQLHEASRPTRSTTSISSEQLLAGQKSVTIDHEGISYVLRSTRAGKLILTK
ncbi:hemin uptake protein HemP [Azoarcus communis]|jgi:hemin uptake protein HemP|uniref:Hemin uptake protein HemP n=2 Tax=Parazoarcus communis TaxID=41977 RepID=A0A323V0H9_9RHOO|nr:hemin uptake protein HemP [Parazoarcus communis]NMG47307.1 hemin uptake protein HemP [Parazoarcus communis]NMG70181.1 hemin uptake protein HemP [Parazoarcus communis SWub3 = DSM 12120]PZA18349.1 hemin uptake protein HemP [Azoarcus communis] [Parazoarcus communis SWub3 = DSM 12120]